MPLLKSLRLSTLLMTVWLSLGTAPAVYAANASLPDFTGIWRLDDQHSDSPSDIATRLRAEEKAEKPTQSAAASTVGTSSSKQTANHRGGRGGGMGGGQGRSGHRNHDKTDDTDNGGTPKADDPPPLLADDSIMNVQQDTKDIHVVFDGKDQLDGRLDGVVRQSLNGNAMVQSHLTVDGLEVSMQFYGEVRLLQNWTTSPDGHHLTVTECWTTPAVKQPIVFKRTYDRLDI